MIHTIANRWCAMRTFQKNQVFVLKPVWKSLMSAPRVMYAKALPHGSICVPSTEQEDMGLPEPDMNLEADMHLKQICK